MLLLLNPLLHQSKPCLFLDLLRKLSVSSRSTSIGCMISGASNVLDSSLGNPLPRPFTFTVPILVSDTSSAENRPEAAHNTSPSSSSTFSFQIVNHPMVSTGSHSQSSHDEDHSDEEQDEQPKKGRTSKAKRRNACRNCKSLKVRCEYEPGASSCRRCSAGRRQCIPRERKQRRPAQTQDELVERNLQMDAQIREMVLQMEELKLHRKVEGWMKTPGTDLAGSNRSLHLAESASGLVNGLHSGVTGDSNPVRFSGRSGRRPSTAASGCNWPIHGPNVLSYGVLNMDDVRRLFDLYFARVNPFFSILDRDLHTPDRLMRESPFLFAVICTIASRYDHDGQRLYELLMNFAQAAAGTALVDGTKSIDICQAYLLMAVYPKPKKSWWEDRSWMLMGLAIRMAYELGLDKPPPADCEERDRLNRIRTWLNCFCVDASHATQFGKPPMIRLAEDYVARNSLEWYKSSQLNLPYDIHLCAYTEMLTLMAEFRGEIGQDSSALDGMIKDGRCDVGEIVVRYDMALCKLKASWEARFAEWSYTQDPELCHYRENTVRLISSYMRLVILSLGFQYAYKTGISASDYITRESVSSAQNVILIMIDKLFPTEILKYAMEAHFLYVAFAAAFLLNFLRPQIMPLVDSEQQRDIVRLVRALIDVLGSDAVALDGRHTPALYARFLSAFLAKHGSVFSDNEASIVADNSPSGSHHHVGLPYEAERQPTPTYAYCSWPDMPPAQPHLSDAGVIQEMQVDQMAQGVAAADYWGYSAGDYGDAAESSIPIVYQQIGQPDMNFSPQYFVQTVAAQNPATVTQDPHQFQAVWNNDVGMTNWPAHVQEYEQFYEHYEQSFSQPGFGYAVQPTYGGASSSAQFQELWPGTC